MMSPAMAMTVGVLRAPSALHAGSLHPVRLGSCQQMPSATSPSASQAALGVAAAICSGWATCTRSSRRSRWLAAGSDGVDAQPQEAVEATTLRTRLSRWWKKNAKLDSKSIRKMGLMCLLSYGFVSNVNAVILILLATYRAILATGSSPLANAAALKQFGIAWAGLYVLSNFLRPLRISLAIAISGPVDKMVNRIKDGLGCKRWLAVTLAVLLLNVFGTIAILYGGMVLISTMTGVPVSASQLGTLIKAGKEARAARGR
eukprot:TRINITY_DN65786_c0_g1_i1.p1 TRINITY_DN65786_c0_g1~~TRINITY_DN65786_c0_g1_i1.p1  ORF type:complete len:259 (-),score=50.57 TRINITY_DN65786_c0_g1_i1:39-815(-)